MKWIYKFARTGVFILGLLTFICAPAFSQNARGVFTLNHEVQWQSQVVPAGDYTFSVEMRGSVDIMTLRNADGAGSAFMLLVNDVDSISPAAKGAFKDGKLILASQSQSGRRYVSSMEVPSIGMVLHFAVPAEGRPFGTSGSASGAAK
jgi:hypothetical protein